MVEMVASASMTEERLGEIAAGIAFASVQSAGGHRVLAGNSPHL